MSIFYHVGEKSKKWQREWICKQTRRSLLWLKFQPQIDTSSETVFSRLMSDLGGQMSCWQIPDDPVRLYYDSSLTALFPRLLHPPLSLSRSPLKNVSRLAQSQSRRLVCFYTTILQTPVRHILWLNGLKKCLIRYVLAYIVMDI